MAKGCSKLIALRASTVTTLVSKRTLLSFSVLSRSTKTGKERIVRVPNSWEFLRCRRVPDEQTREEKHEEKSTEGSCKTTEKGHT